MALITELLQIGDIIVVEDSKKSFVLRNKYSLLTNMGNTSLYSGVNPATYIPLYYEGSFATTTDDALATAQLGDECFCFTDGKFYKYNGADWIAIN